MTKDQLLVRLQKHESMADIFELSSGQDCEIYKADKFSLGDEIIYIPDFSLNALYGHAVNNEVAESLVGECYTGDDFLRIASGNVENAERLFWFCDWQHPEGVLDEGVLDPDEEE